MICLLTYIKINRSFPGIFGNQEQHYMQVIHNLLLQSLADSHTNISFLAVKAVTAFMKNHEKNIQVINSFKDCLPLILRVGSIN